MTLHGPTHTAWDRNLSHHALVLVLLVMAAQITALSKDTSYAKRPVSYCRSAARTGAVTVKNDVGSTSIYGSFGTS